MGVLTAVFVVFLAGSADRIDVLFGVSYSGQLWLYRIAFVVAPLVTAIVAHRVCVELQRGELVVRDARAAEQEARAAARDAAASPARPPGGARPSSSSNDP
jgi:hypothetical protein